MPSGPYAAVTDAGTTRWEARVDRRGVQPIVDLRVFDICEEEFHTRAGSLSLSQARQQAMRLSTELDEHEWAFFLQYVMQINTRLHKEREQIAVEQGWVQNQTEQPARPVPVWSAPPEIPEALQPGRIIEVNIEPAPPRFVRRRAS